MSSNSIPQEAGELRIPVVFSTDHNFIMPTGVAILSMLKCSQDCFCDIRILQHRDVTDIDRQTLKDIVEPFNAEIRFITMGTEFDSGFQIRGISTPCYYRLMIPWLFPNLDKVVYCDGDVIFKQSVKKLFEQSVENAYIGGVCTLFDSNYLRNYLSTLNLEYTEYINSGVLVVNSKMQRDANLVEKYKAEAKKKYTFQDQDILNVVCKGKISHLPPKFNFFSRKAYSTAELYMKNIRYNNAIGGVRY